MSSRGSGVAVVLVLAACTGGGSFSVGGSSFSPNAGSTGSGREPGADLPPLPTPELPMPVVACSLPDAGGDDGGELVDAESPPFPEDGGVDDSPCATPPPVDCASATVMVVWSPGVCDGEQCVFGSTSVECPGGCFRQLDGGDRCVE